MYCCILGIYGLYYYLTNTQERCSSTCIQRQKRCVLKCLLWISAVTDDFLLITGCRVLQKFVGWLGTKTNHDLFVFVNQTTHPKIKSISTFIWWIQTMPYKSSANDSLIRSLSSLFDFRNDLHYNCNCLTWALFCFRCANTLNSCFLSRDGLNFIYSIYACNLTLPVNIHSVPREWAVFLPTRLPKRSNLSLTG